MVTLKNKSKKEEEEERRRKEKERQQSIPKTQSDPEDKPKGTPGRGGGGKSAPPEAPTVSKPKPAEDRSRVVKPKPFESVFLTEKDGVKLDTPIDITDVSQTKGRAREAKILEAGGAQEEEKLLADVEARTEELGISEIEESEIQRRLLTSTDDIARQNVIDILDEIRLDQAAQERVEKVMSSPIEGGENLGLSTSQVIGTEFQNSNVAQIDKDLLALEQIFSDLGVFEFAGEDVIDILSNRQELSEIDSNLGKLGELLSSIKGQSDANGIPPTEALARLNRIERDILLLEANMKATGILRPQAKITGEYTNVVTELSKTKEELAEARAHVFVNIQENNPFIDIPRSQAIQRELNKKIGR
tara:strand:- start:1998 stop:3077 length:1080 start_codon:yes stop_codon:yes gene_type:complete